MHRTRDDFIGGETPLVGGVSSAAFQDVPGAFASIDGLIDHSIAVVICRHWNVCRESPLIDRDPSFAFQHIPQAFTTVDRTIRLAVSVVIPGTGMSVEYPH